MRDIRFRFIGTIFFFVLAICLLSSRSTIQLIINLYSQNVESSIITSLVALGAVFLTSEGIGFIFNSINLRLISVLNSLVHSHNMTDDFYSAEWRSLSYDLKEDVIADYFNNNTSGLSSSEEKNASNNHGKFISRFKKYQMDVIFSYFWQSALKQTVDWVARRHTAFFTSTAVITSIGFAIITALILMAALNLVWTIATLIIIILLGLIILILLWNALEARSIANNMIDLWLAQAYNDELKNGVNPYDWTEQVRIG